MNCSKCGKHIPDNMDFCENCGQIVTGTAAVEAPAKPEKRENVIAGIVGALIGALIGGGCIILLSQLGYVASLSGLVLAICTLKGYELLGGRLSKKGIIISIIFVLATPYIADRIDWAILILKEFSDYNITFADAFAAVPAMIEEGAIESGVYIKNLLMIYGFAALGAFTTLRNAFKK